MAKRRQLAEIRVQLERVPKGERAVPFDYPDNVGLRTKLGGKPDWIQRDATPVCDSCEEPMCFVAQIDSIAYRGTHHPPGEKGPGFKDYMFGDVGMIYVFYCFDCMQPACLVQCY